MQNSQIIKKPNGFTIVELLIVIVVIAVLAAIAIVSYNGITQRAYESGLKSDLTTSASKLEIDRVKSGDETYPDILSEANDGFGLRTDSSNTLQYTLGDINAKSFCLSISSSRTDRVYNYLSTRGTPQEGYCVGHSGSSLSTLAGSTSGYLDDPVGTNARFSGPSDIAVAPNGNVYVSDRSNHRIRQITSAGAVTTIAGTGVAGWSDNTTGTSAQFNAPMGIDIDNGGNNLYVADAGTHRIRRIALTAPYAVTTIAGNGTAGYLDSATGTSAQFNNPYGLAVASTGVVYVAEANGNRIRSISVTNAVSTLAGPTTGTAGASGATDSPTGSLARFNAPHGIAVDSSDTIYVADNYNHRIRQVTPGGSVTTIAGTTDGFNDGAALSSQFSWPEAVAVSNSGTIYVADSYNSLIRSISSGTVSTLVGQRFNSGFSNGVGANGRINYPWGIDVDSAGVVYVADTWNNRIRTIQVK